MEDPRPGDDPAPGEEPAAAEPTRPAGSSWPDDTRPVSRNAKGIPDAWEDLHGPPYAHPYLPEYHPQDDPITIMHRAAGIDDHTERARELTKRLALAQEWVTWGSQQRDAAVLQMRAAGASYDDIASALSISKSRAQQLVGRLARRWPNGMAWSKQAHVPGGSRLLEVGEFDVHPPEEGRQ